MVAPKGHANAKFDVYLCNKFVDFYVKDVKIHKFDVYLCLVIFSFFCTQWPWRDTQTWKSASDIHVCVSQKGHADVNSGRRFYFSRLGRKKTIKPLHRYTSILWIFTSLTWKSTNLLHRYTSNIYVCVGPKGTRRREYWTRIFFSKLSTMIERTWVCLPLVTDKGITSWYRILCPDSQSSNCRPYTYTYSV